MGDAPQQLILFPRTRLFDELQADSTDTIDKAYDICFRIALIGIKSQFDLLTHGFAGLYKALDVMVNIDAAFDF